MRLVLISNRLPINIKEENGRVEILPSVGGLVTGVSAYLDTVRDSLDYVWLGWPGRELSQETLEFVKMEAFQKYNAFPVQIPESLNEKFYYGFCNKTIWPLFHYFPTFTEYDPEYWDAYEKVNQIFLESVSEIIQPGDMIWIHDYHLLLLPGLLRKRFPNVQIGFFLHIPFPTYEIFRLLPAVWRKNLLAGLLGADLIGFHTHDYTQYYLHCILRILGLETNFGEIIYENRLVKVDTFPMGIDFEKFARIASNPKSDEVILENRRAFGSTRLILSVDRLDYSKGVYARLEAFERFLEKYPHWKTKANLILIVVPSREEVDQYQEMKKAIDEIVGRINGKFATLDWTPIRYQYRMLNIDELVPLYRMSDAILVTPFRDGMNLVAKEYIASKTDKKGVLILSETAGASKELGEAIIVNPNNIEEMADAILEALEMEEEEQIQRNTVLQQRTKRYDVVRWASDFMKTLDLRKTFQNKLKSKLIDKTIREKIFNQFSNNKKKLIFLDYDGTLVPFQKKPELAFPSQELKSLLVKLSRMENTEIIIISGRDRETLIDWMTGVDVSIVAEHGAWIRERGKDWRLFKQAPNDWKPRISPILEQNSDRLPGSFVEEKNFSLVFHYRNADPELAEVRVKELTDDLVNFTANMDVSVLQGNKVIEVKNTGISKGYAGLDLIEIYKPDEILSIGDDWTDEDLFRALPSHAVSIKVGLGPSNATYNLKDYEEVREFLNGISS
ncbi:bifunctional alpha,alpha-trehalose-phosphate synthase (UDP-forming)/trehalose-phosphatase [Leptospira sp. GIMC2001]|uniref:bifunctional alpha,alpha-trehalose-phosphate synthase (UDP-forming)/trehalose-phosphatase n=1 Tax=Leptospira sp. GIMC2001 TaxID=1513297 RepID=UPI00234B5DEC|nr:bifunctional alpha,alpha-trehalose-phosphate synthase (UDP-forming)/trehalose-phosphatase [Leptospira sp. GIMC2001]WCL48329.1 bifunctional alpha,alpha-trehalose-phosphate synthase (UDP-forming)/trehalose-phosphatase [Leptospira sp. GIMC2001]